MNATPEVASDDLAHVLINLKKTIAADISVCEPAIVQDYDRETGIAFVTRLTKVVHANGGTVEPVPFRVSVLSLQHGGFHVSAPLFRGDTGWLISSDLTTSSIKRDNSSIQGAETGIGSVDPVTHQPYGNAGPRAVIPTLRHKASHGFFIPDKWGGVPLPDDMMDSLVVEQVNPNGSSHGRFVMDPDGTVRMFSTRWLDERETDITKRVKGGTVFVDLRYKYPDPALKQDIVGEGDISAIASLSLSGNAVISSWVDEYKNSHGGNLFVENNADIGGSEAVHGNSSVYGGLSVDGESEFRSKLEVVKDSKRAIIDPRNDLHKTDAKFREVTVVTGLKHDKDDQNKVALRTRKIRILADEGERDRDVEFEVGGSTHYEGDVLADLHSVDFKGKDEALELAEFQSETRVLDETLESAINKAVEENKDTDGTLVVRNQVGDATKKVFYRPVGKLVTAIKYSDSKLQGVVGIEASQDVDNTLSITHDARKNTLVFKSTGGGGSGKDGKTPLVDLEDVSETTDTPPGVKIIVAPDRTDPQKDRIEKVVYNRAPNQAGINGEKNIVVGMEYKTEGVDHPQLIAKMAKVTYDDGVVVKWVEAADVVVFTATPHVAGS